MVLPMSMAHSTVLSSTARRPFVLVFASMGDKNADVMLEILGAAVDRIIVTRAVIERSAEPSSLLPLAEAVCPGAESAPGTDAALERARAVAGPGGLVVVAGSLFLIGEARARLLGLEGPGNPPRSAVPPPPLP